MKRFILLLLCLVPLFAIGQNKTATIGTGYTLHDQLRFNAADTVTANRTAYTVQVVSPQKYFTNQYVAVALDTLTSGNAKVHMLGSIFGVSYAACSDTLTYTGSGGATTINLSNTTPVPYQYFRVIITRQSGSIAVKGFKFKQLFVLPIAND